jgi:hypothetical protein
MALGTSESFIHHPANDRCSPKIAQTFMLQESPLGTGCVKTRHEISFLKFDRAGCAVSHDRLSGKGSKGHTLNQSGYSARH